MTDHRVVLGDCLDPVAGLASLPDKSVDHVICDPPYEAEAHTLQRRVKRGGGSNGREGQHKGVMCIEPISFAPISEEGRAASVREIARITRRWVVLFCQVEAAVLWRDAFVDAGLEYRRTGVWVKPDGMPQYSGDRPAMGYESLVLCHAPGRSAWNGGGRHGVWVENKIGPDDRDRTGHETQKPLALMESLVRDFTDPGELICDPFAGSGTTGVACKRLGRRFVGWEKSEPYWRIAQKRIAAAREQLGLFREKAPREKQAALSLPPEAE